MSRREKPSVALWMPVFINDARARASTLSHLEHSCLNYLHMALWEHDGSIPDDDRWIAKHLRVTVRQWQAMRPALLADCTITGGRIVRAATETELAKARRLIAQKSAAGKASAEARALQRPFNDRSTTVQPRAGGCGEVSKYTSLIQEEGSEGSLSHAREAGPFAVIRGGGK